MKKMRDTLAHRFGAALPEIAREDGPQTCPETWQQLAGRGSCRYFQPRRVAPELIETLCALALSSPTKSDLQQRDIVIIEDAAIRGRIDALLSTVPWRRSGFPAHRPPRVLRQQPPAASAARVARQAVRQRPPRRVLQCRRRCGHRAVGIRHRGRGGGNSAARPSSAIRNHARRSPSCSACRSRLSGRGLGFGWPSRRHHVSLRLPLSATAPRPLQRGRHRGDRRRLRSPPRGGWRPYDAARHDVFGTADFYGWSEDKVRQYASPRARRLGRIRAQEGEFRLE